MDKHVELAAIDDAPGEARAQLRSTLTEWNLLPCLDDALLVTSELVTNAARHGKGEVKLHIRATDGLVRIEVEDSSTQQVPERRNPSDTSPGGRGLILVDALSERWGWENGTKTKTVWAELDCRKTSKLAE